MTGPLPGPRPHLDDLFSPLPDAPCIGSKDTPTPMDHVELKRLLNLTPQTPTEHAMQQALVWLRGSDEEEVPVDLPDLDAMREEHDAYRELFRRLAELAGVEGHALNSTIWHPVVHQLRYWGETLVQLRRAAPEYVEQAYQEAKRLADGHRDA